MRCLFCFCPGLGETLERVLGGAAKPAELAHVDMKSKLKDAWLTHFVDHPHLWPPMIAVLPPPVAYLSVLMLGLSAFRQVRELATKVKKLGKAGEEKPYVASDLKK